MKKKTSQRNSLSVESSTDGRNKLSRATIVVKGLGRNNNKTVVFKMIREETESDDDNDVIVIN